MLREGTSFSQRNVTKTDKIPLEQEIYSLFHSMLKTVKRLRMTMGIMFNCKMEEVTLTNNLMVNLDRNKR